MSFFKKLGGALTGAAAGFFTGGLPGALVGGLSGYEADKSARDQQNAQSQAMSQAQGGIDAQIQGQKDALAAAMSGQQISYDLMRGLQEQQIPWQQASLGALQTLPLLQQALGLPSYQIPDTLRGLPDVDFMARFNEAIGQYGQSGQAGQGDINSAPAGMETTQQQPQQAQQGRPFMEAFNTFRRDSPAQAQPGQTLPQQPMQAQLMQQPQQAQQGQQPLQQGQLTTLNPSEPGQFSLEASPMYQFQKREVTEALRNQLAAQGLGQSTYGQREESRMRESIAAHERERQVRDMMQMVGIGMGGIPQMSGAEMMPAAAGAGMAQSYANMGAIQGQGAMGMAQMGIDAQTARAGQMPAWMQGLQVAGMMGSGGMFGSGKVGNVPSFGNVQNQAFGMMGVPVPIFR